MADRRIVKAYGYEERAVEEFDEINKRLQKYSLRAIFFSSITNPSTRFVNSLVYAAVAVAGAFSAIGGGITVGQLSSFLSYATQYTKPFNEISGVITELQNAIACAGRMFELIEEEPEIPDAPSAVSVTDIDGRVDLNNVYFSYTPDRKLIEDFTLHVKKGQKIAIVGPTGCGKTTVINLLMRFYDVNSGSIDVSGVDIMGYDKIFIKTRILVWYYRKHGLRQELSGRISLWESRMPQKKRLLRQLRLHTHTDL